MTRPGPCPYCDGGGKGVPIAECTVPEGAQGTCWTARLWYDVGHAAERNITRANATIESLQAGLANANAALARSGGYGYGDPVTRKPGPPWRASQVTLHAIDEKPAALVADAATAQQVEELGGRLMQAMVKEHVETQLAPPAPECAGCKRWTHRIKVLEERVEHARKVLEGL